MYEKKRDKSVFGEIEFLPQEQDVCLLLWCYVSFLCFLRKCLHRKTET